MKAANRTSKVLALMIPVVLIGGYTVTAWIGSDRSWLHVFMTRMWPIYLAVFVVLQQRPMHSENYTVGRDLQSDQTVSWIPTISLGITVVVLPLLWALWQALELGWTLDWEILWFLAVTTPVAYYDAQLQKIGTFLKAAARGERPEI